MAVKDIDATVLKTAINRVAEIPELQMVLEQMAGTPILLEARDGRRAIPLDSLVDLLPLLGKLLPQIGKLLPVLLMLFTGGFSPAVFAAVLPILADMLGISLSDTRAQIQAALQLEANS